MTTVNSATDPAAAVSALGSSTTSKAQTTESTFLQLLVTQMKNQDPLNPMDNAQVTSQIAQLDTVQGVDTLNTTLTALAGNFASSQSIQAASLIGHSVLVPGSSLTLQGGSAPFGVSLPQSVDGLSVSILDGSGAVIDTLNLGPQAAGTVTLGWNGATSAGKMAADGSYSFAVSATSGGASAPATPLNVTPVLGVTPSASGIMLNLGSSKSVALSAVNQIM